MSEARRKPHNKLEIDEDFIRENYHKMSAREIGEILEYLGKRLIIELYVWGLGRQRYLSNYKMVKN